jgi:hypothetical protein
VVSPFQGDEYQSQKTQGCARAFEFKLLRSWYIAEKGGLKTLPVHQWFNSRVLAEVLLCTQRGAASDRGEGKQGERRRKRRWLISPAPFSSGFSPATLRTVNKLDLFATSFGIQGV